MRYSDKSKVYPTYFLSHIYNKMRSDISTFDHEAYKDVDYSKAKLDSLPNSLYKFYRPEQNIIDTVCKDNIWVSSIDPFNDPNEGRLLFDENGFFQTTMCRLFKNNKLIAVGDSSDQFSKKEYFRMKYGIQHTSTTFSDCLFSFLQNKSDSLCKKIRGFDYKLTGDLHSLKDAINRKPFQICCFSEIYDNPPMWAHYSKNYSGFCIEYDLSQCKLAFQNSVQSENMAAHLFVNRLFPIKYTTKIPRMCKSSMVNFRDPSWGKQIEFKQMQSLLTKGNAWKYEKEWRLVLDNKLSYLEGDGRKVSFPYIKSIVFGYNMDPQNMNQIASSFIGRNIPIDILIKSEFKYELEKISYEDYLQEQEQDKKRVCHLR